MFTYKVDDELELMLLTERNAEEMHRLVRENIDHLKVWLPWVTEDYSLDAAKYFVWQNLAEFTQNKGFTVAVIHNGETVGQVGLHDINSVSKLTQVNYWLIPKAQGRGLITKSCRTLINYAFNELGLNRVEIECETRNTKSRAVPERLGFHLEGERRQAAWLHDHFIDLAHYAMLVGDWKR